MNGLLVLWCLSASSAVSLSVFETVLETWIKNTPRLPHKLLTACRSRRRLACACLQRRLFFLWFLGKTVGFFFCYRFQFPRAQCHELPVLTENKFLFNDGELVSALRPIEFRTFALKLSLATPLNAAKLDTQDIKDKKKKKRKKC